jgi:hypothetical protein
VLKNDQSRCHLRSRGIGLEELFSPALRGVGREVVVCHSRSGRAGVGSQVSAADPVEACAEERVTRALLDKALSG